MIIIRSLADLDICHNDSEIQALLEMARDDMNFTIAEYNSVGCVYDYRIVGESIVLEKSDPHDGSLLGLDILQLKPLHIKKQKDTLFRIVYNLKKYYYLSIYFSSKHHRRLSDWVLFQK